mgnify:CR=1 FL=1
MDNNISIKYGEITIIRNLQEESILNYFNRLLGNENKTNENDTIIILFDDGIICDVKKEYNTNLHNHIKMTTTSSLSRYFPLPIYFEIEETKETFFSSRSESDSTGKSDVEGDSESLKLSSTSGGFKIDNATRVKSGK